MRLIRSAPGVRNRKRDFKSENLPYLQEEQKETKLSFDPLFLTEKSAKRLAIRCHGRHIGCGSAVSERRLHAVEG